jgi:uncharacterized RDD family membrane protein YckC
MSAAAQATPRTPSIARRLASMLYEAFVLAAIAFAAGNLFLLASVGQPASGWMRFALQLYLLAVFAAYFLWCWLRGGQTLPMRAWRIRLVAPGHARVPARVALLRFAYATLFVGSFLACLAAAFVHRNALLAFASLALSGIGVGWALVDRDGQFLHDRLAGTRLIQVD